MAAKKLWMWMFDETLTTIVRAPDRMAAARVLLKGTLNDTDVELEKRAIELEEVPLDGPDKVLFEFY